MKPSTSADASSSPRTWPFVVTAIVITYALGIPVYVGLEWLQGRLGTDIALLNDRLMAFGPSLAALVVVARQRGRAGLVNLLQSLGRWPAHRWLIGATILFPPLLQLGVLVGRGQLGGEVWSGLVRHFPGQLLLAVLLGGGLGEELGWRAYMADTLQRRMGELRAAAIVGLWWFVWHLPAYALADKGSSDPIAPFFVICVAASVVLLRVYILSGGSAWAPILLHGSLNASFYALEEAAPALLTSAGFQPMNDYIVAAGWCLAAALVFGLSRKASASSEATVM